MLGAKACGVIKTLFGEPEFNIELLSDRTMQTWNFLFLEHLARDRILLYTRGSLPAPLAA